MNCVRKTTYVIESGELSTETIENGSDTFIDLEVPSVRLLQDDIWPYAVLHYARTYWIRGGSIKSSLLDGIQGMEAQAGPIAMEPRPPPLEDAYKEVERR